MILEHSTLKDLITENDQTTFLFQSFGIDYTIHPCRTLAEVCESRAIEIELLIECLNSIEQGSIQNFTSLSQL